MGTSPPLNLTIFSFQAENILQWEITIPNIGHGVLVAEMPVVENCHVLMFPKPGQNAKLPGDYRPISLPSNLGKVYEKVILNRLKDQCHDLMSSPTNNMGSDETMAAFINCCAWPTL
ncbi:hypothetical protein AVEN_73801-1 [Araneus ventricosus]|uniref:Reverse transcriptase domain-containing protein n=1 Tax=Araneus ventricosus TaxID=182803 RepID=A0A4Y2HE01_ARAVE|nr:hypothetical protein AVEN_73801-1 [Araneus ventricosus]